MIHFLAAAALVSTASPHPSPAELAKALFTFTGQPVSSAAIRNVTCDGFEEEPTEFACSWQQRTRDGWRNYNSYLAVDRDRWTLIDNPAPAKQTRQYSPEEDQFRKWLASYFGNDPDDRDVQNLVYGYALVDLNGDGKREGLAWARDANLCGTGGCGLYLFVRHKTGWKLFDYGPTTRPPIKVLPTRTRGWRDLSSWQAGGGIVHPYEIRLRFTGKGYEAVWPRDWTGEKSHPHFRGRVVIENATISLFPSKCRKVTQAQSIFGPMLVQSGPPGSC